jgi:hypothetical protein
VGVAFVLAVLAPGCRAQGGVQSAQQESTDAEVPLVQCDEDDVIFDSELFVVDQTGGPSNPEKALEKYLKRHSSTDGIPSSAFKPDKEKKNSAGQVVEVELTDGEESQTAGESPKTKARVFTRNFGESWFVTRAVFCQKYIDEKDKDKSS